MGCDRTHQLDEDIGPNARYLENEENEDHDKNLASCNARVFSYQLDHLVSNGCVHVILKSEEQSARAFSCDKRSFFFYRLYRLVLMDVMMFVWSFLLR